MEQKNYCFIQNRKCEYFPCHKGVREEDFNCLFCYCPLYLTGRRCGGNCRILENGIKDCTECTFPHRRQNYDSMLEKLNVFLFEQADELKKS